jgi:integrase
VATISKRTTRTGVRYIAQVRLKGYPPQSRAFERKTDARDWARETETNIRSGQTSGLAGRQRHTLSELVEKYVEEVLPGKPAVAASYGRQLAWWKDELGVHYLSDLTSELIEQAYRKLLREPGPTGRKRSATTANRYLISFSSCLSFGRKKLKWLSGNPLSGVEKEAEPRGRVRFLSRPVDGGNSELERLLSTCKDSPNPDLYDLVVLAIWTGCREGELMALRRSWVRLSEGGFTLPAEVTKTRRERFVALVGPALEVVARRMKNAGTDYLFAGALRKNSSQEPAFPRRAWNSVRRKARIVDFRFHDLRHTHASYLAMSGATERELMESLGHSTPSMASRYAHLANGHKRLVASRLEAAVEDWARGELTEASVPASSTTRSHR